MSWNDAMKWVAGLVLIGLWATAAYLKMTPIEPLISFVSMTLGFLARHIITPEVVVQGAAAPINVGSGVVLPNGDPRPHLYVPGREGGWITPHFAEFLIWCILVAACGAIFWQILS